MPTMETETNEINSQNTNELNDGGEGMNKYGRIERILKEIDDDDWLSYLDNFKKQKMDDKAVFDENLFGKDHSIWTSLIPEIVIRERFLREVKNMKSTTVNNQ